MRSLGCVIPWLETKMLDLVGEKPWKLGDSITCSLDCWEVHVIIYERPFFVRGLLEEQNPLWVFESPPSGLNCVELIGFFSELHPVCYD